MNRLFNCFSIRKMKRAGVFNIIRIKMSSWIMEKYSIAKTLSKTGNMGDNYDKEGNLLSLVTEIVLFFLRIFCVFLHFGSNICLSGKQNCLWIDLQTFSSVREANFAASDMFFLVLLNGQTFSSV